MVLTLVSVLIGLRLAAQLLLNALNASEVRRHAGGPPPAVAAIMDHATYVKAVDYTLAKLRLGSLEEIYEAAVLAAVVFSGLLPWLYAPLQTWAPGRAWSGALFLLAVGCC